MIADSAKLDAIRSEFITAVQDTFGDRPGTTYQAFTETVPVSGTRAEIIVVDGAPAPREFIGQRQFGSLRAYKLSEELTKYERSIAIDRQEVLGDNGAGVVRRLQQFAAESANMIDYAVLTHLLTNPTCYDGVALLSNSHVNVGGSGTSDNLETAALSFSLFHTAEQKLSEMKDEAGEPLAGQLTHLLVGPAQKEKAMQITGSTRPASIDESGNANQGSGGVGSVLFDNFVGGSAQVLVTSRITGNEWFAMDLSKGARKPMYYAELEAPYADAIDDRNSDHVAKHDENLYFITARGKPMAGDWRTIVGSVTA